LINSHLPPTQGWYENGEIDLRHIPPHEMSRRALLEKVISRLLKDVLIYEEEKAKLEKRREQPKDEGDEDCFYKTKLLDSEYNECISAMNDCNHNIEKYLEELKVILSSTGEEVETPEVKKLLLK
jgi:hypothetical protein